MDLKSNIVDPYIGQTAEGKKIEFESVESINNVTLKDVKNYYSTYAIPNNAYLTIVGDVKFDDIKPLVEDLFGNWKKGKSLETKLTDLILYDESKEEIVNFLSIDLKQEDFDPCKVSRKLDLDS